MSVRHFLGVVGRFRLILLFVALVPFSSPDLHGDDKKDDKKEEIARLAKDFKSLTTNGKERAIKQLSQLGEGAARPLCDAMLDRNDKIANAALVALESAHPKLYNPVAKLVLDADMKNRAKALEELAAMGAAAQPSIGLLSTRGRAALAVTKDNQQALAVVKAYAKTIATIGAEEQETIDFFKDAAKSPVTQVNTEALKWLVAWAGDQETRRKELLPCLKRGIALPGNEAIPFINAAGQYKGLSKEFLPQLKKLKLSSSAPVRAAATEAVEAIEE